MKKVKEIAINVIILLVLSFSILLTFSIFFMKPEASSKGYFTDEGIKYYKEEGTCPVFKYYKEEGTCPVCHEELIKYCYGKDCPHFVWSCPNNCENK